jgi:hypothetical protein
LSAEAGALKQHYSVEENDTKKCPYLPESCERNKAAMDRAGIK